MGKNLMNNKTIIIKGDETKFYDEVIFVMKNRQPDNLLADTLAEKIINRHRAENIIKAKALLEIIFYICVLVLVIAIASKIVLMK